MAVFRMHTWVLLLCLSTLTTTATLAFQQALRVAGVVRHCSTTNSYPQYVTTSFHAIQNTNDSEQLATTSTTSSSSSSNPPFFAAWEDDTKTTSANVKLSLQEKMSQWDATDAEIKAATLGGVTPGGLGGKKRIDGFDIGLYIAFPFMIAGSLLFALFPFIMDKIDVTSVGPPPMI